MPDIGQRFLAELRTAGFTVTRRAGPQIIVDPASKLAPGQREGLGAHRLDILRALNLEERPDSGLTVGTLPLMGEAYWIARKEVSSWTSKDNHQAPAGLGVAGRPLEHGTPYRLKVVAAPIAVAEPAITVETDEAPF